MNEIINNFITNNKIKIFPSKRKNKELILKYLIKKFEKNKVYTEKQINEIIKDNILFDDYATIRRELFDYNLLNRDINGTNYKVNNEILEGETNEKTNETNTFDF